MKKPSPKDLIKFMKSQAEIGVEVMKFVTMNKQDIIEIKKQVEVQQNQIKTLAENAGLIDQKPQLKTLDQSVFDDKPEHINWAVVTKDGSAMTFQFKPAIIDNLWSWTGDHRLHSLINQYDASNWKNSLIERESKELTGSDLCRAMLARGDRFVMCAVSNDGEEDTLLDGYYVAVSSIGVWGVFEAYAYDWLHATPINNMGEPLTAKEAGL